jgi:broad specificity phosphatase PhoE
MIQYPRWISPAPIAQGDSLPVLVLAEAGLEWTGFLVCASLIALETASAIGPEPAIQEGVFGEGIPEFAGLTLKQMQQLYPAVVSPSAFPYPWFREGPESFCDVTERVRPFVAWLRKTGAMGTFAAA